MKSYSDEAIVLRRFFTGEQDIILVLLSKFHGKVRAIAKGARSIRSSRGGHLDLFNHITVQIHEGKGLDYLNEVQTKSYFAEAKADLLLSRHMYYIAELLDTLILEEDAHPSVFEQTVRAFSSLLTASDHIDITMRDYELHLLQELGYWSHSEHGVRYPGVLASQREFNQMLLREVMGRDIKALVY